MELEQTVFIPSERSVVWAGLNDPEILKRSLPGCEHFEVTGENQFEMVVTTRIGPVKATFRGKIELSNIEAPHRYVINGEGKGCLLYTSPSPRDATLSRMPSSA